MGFWHHKWEGAQPKEADCLDQSRMCSVLGACRSAHYPFNGGLLVFCNIGITGGAGGISPHYFVGLICFPRQSLPAREPLIRSSRA